jgi:DNA repair protein RecN (Recombination protein N)
VLTELDIRNFAIIDELHLRFAGGLTVLTGETGAGKSIIIDALGILLGGRAAPDLIREGEALARIEGVFLAAGRAGLTALLAEYGIDLDDGAIILSRELARGGRSTARVNGRALPVAVVQRLSQHLVDIHGQTEHLALLRSADQLAMLDRHAGLADRREQVAALVRRLRALRTAIAQLSGDQREAARRLDLLRFQVEEIDTVAPKPGEDATLAAELRVLASAEKLRQLAVQLHDLLAGADEAASAEDVLGAALRVASELARIDPAQAEVVGRLQATLGDVQEAAREVRRYADAIEEDPARLAALLDRQEALRALKRKYGATIEDVLAFRDDASREAATIGRTDERRAELEAEEAVVAAEAGAAAGQLSAARREAAVVLAQRVQHELSQLNMGGAEFQVRVTQRPDPAGLVLGAVIEHADRAVQRAAPAADMGAGNISASVPVAFDLTGVDQVEFLIAPNVGESPKPVARIASGGETSRIMLALKSALTEADETATLVFDEVDVGVGGRSGRVIGEKLWRLARRHQVLCITHLPQVAAFGDQHAQIRKVVQRGRTMTAVELVDGDERVRELAQMVGGTAVNAATRQAALVLLDQAQEWKSGVPRA